MSNATDMLVQEHDLIERMLPVLRKAAHALQADENFPLAPFEQAVDFIRNFADKRHHGKEEDILFQLMQKKGMPAEGGPIGVMLHEHQLARNCTAELAQAIDKVRAGDKSAIKTIIENARYYADLLANHIYKENNILYPMGNQAFSGADQDYLHAEFDRVNQSLGEGVLQDYQNLVDSLEKELKIER